MPPIPTAPERRQIAGLAIVPEKGVLRVYRYPDKVRPSSLARVTRAAIELGLPPPVQPTAPKEAPP